MKSTPLKIVCATILAGLLAVPSFGQAVNVNNPERMLERMDQLLAFTDQQKVQVTAIVTRACDELAALSEEARLRDTGLIRPRMRAEIRALLTPDQQKKYDRTPQMDGGGLTLQTPENKVARLNALIPLTPAQKTAALEIFNKELDALLDLPEAQRLQQGAPVRQAARKEVRAILTPDQLAKYNAAPQSQGGAAGTRD